MIEAGSPVWILTKSHGKTFQIPAVCVSVESGGERYTVRTQLGYEGNYPARLIKEKEEAEK